jgi:endoglucanase
VFDFKPDRDLSLLVPHNHTVELWVRGNNPSGKFDLRFIDTKFGETDRPWRMGKMIDATVAPWDGAWHKLSIPLKDFRETGAWDNAFFPPEGKFDWKDVDRFEIVSEYGPLNGIEFWFDDIRVAGEDVPYEEPPPVTSVEGEAKAPVYDIFPNPMRDMLSIHLTLSRPGHVTIAVYSLNGQKVAVLADEDRDQGSHEFSWDAPPNDKEMPPGIYFLKIRSGDRQGVRKIVRY